MRQILRWSYVALSFGWNVAGQRVCNNAAALCDRSYNNVTFLGAHDSPFVRNAANDFNLFGNQFYDSLTQLNAGVRLLSGQVHKNNTSWDLCHTGCAFIDAGTLTSWLSNLKGWLDANPNEVVTILLVNSDNADATTLDQQFQAADIVKYAYVPPTTSSATKDWPTLNEMIDQNKRLVAYIANLDPADNTVAPYLLDEFTFAFENNYDISDPSKFDCAPDRPSNLKGQAAQQVISTGYLPLMNHFLYNNINGIEIPAEDKVNNTNAASGTVGNLGEHASKCTAEYGRAPSYVLVDFFNVARAIDTVDTLNGVSGQTSGRISLPDTVEGSRAESASTTSGSLVTTLTSATTSPTSSTNTTQITTSTSTRNAGASCRPKNAAKYAAAGAGVYAML